MGFFDWLKHGKDDLDDDVGRVPDALPVIRKETVFSACSKTTTGMPRIIVERGNEYPTQNDDFGWRFPVVVPNVLQDRKLTREQIKEVFFVHQTHCLKRPDIGHPEADKCPPHHVLMERVENLFLGTDQKHFEHILSELQKKFPALDLKWTYGVLTVHGAKTKIRCSGIDKTYHTLRGLGTRDGVEDLIVALISKQLHEIFVG